MKKINKHAVRDLNYTCKQSGERCNAVLRQNQIYQNHFVNIFTHWKSCWNHVISRWITWELHVRMLCGAFYCEARATQLSFFSHGWFLLAMSVQVPSSRVSLCRGHNKDRLSCFNVWRPVLRNKCYVTFLCKRVLGQLVHAAVVSVAAVVVVV